ncbi:hypothetical protein [Aequorivita antarctica]|uniref:DUF4251 domain-containing protein n=1 Tax=Aequorivita antarctica TaxID=153266 RepID=A0A5C6Z1B6_9FLAO|nr:hypothetical protein [Aequorivita antarctica]TXD73250.1 hypothetical protein ESU54_08925 [Aequorivita antarctica]SRX76003.1 hypothetical protein AEQU3_03001 [Aequorivita antarctica]
MKTIFIFLIFILSSFNSQAQQELPEFIEKPTFFDTQSNKLVDLEKSQYNTITKSKGLFGAEGGFFLNGVTSKVRIPKTSSLKFIVKVNPGVDPTSILDLVQFEIKNDKRVFITTKSKGTSTSTSFEKISYDVEKIKEGYYYLIVKNIDTGEFFFGSNDFMYAFSVN